jgi:Cu+-exporting ATPase
LAALCRQSGHPLSRAIAGWAGPSDPAIGVEKFKETIGKGISGSIKQHQFQLGSADFLAVEPLKRAHGQVFLRIDGVFFGGFTVHNRYRSSFPELIGRLGPQFELHLLSGDNDRESKFLSAYFPKGHLHFRQSPGDKLQFIRSLQQSGHKVMMIGDGLNDAGALQQSEVGMVIAENTNNFTPASDAILDAVRFADIPALLRYSRRSNRLVIYAYVLAIIYNIIGLSFAVQGLLSPVIAAILMPLSSITIVAFGVLSSRLLALRSGLNTVRHPPPGTP